MRILPILLVAGIFAGCASGPAATPPGASNAPTTTTSTTTATTTSTTTATTTSTTTATAAPVLNSQPSPTAPRATTVPANPAAGNAPVPGGEIPMDLRGAPPATVGERADVDDPNVVGQDLAIAWVMERYTARSDEPATDRQSRLAALTANPTLSNSAPPAPAQVAGTATWPINVTVEQHAGNEWQVGFTLNQTPATQPLEQLSVIVAVDGDQIVGERSP